MIHKDRLCLGLGREFEKAVTALSGRRGSGTCLSAGGLSDPVFDRGLSEISAGLCGAGRSPGLCRPGRARLSGSGGH